MPCYCSECKSKIIRDAGDYVKCNVCDNIYHARCQRMGKSEFENYVNSSPAQKSSWSCLSCRERRISVKEKDPVMVAESAKVSMGSEFSELKKFLETRFDHVEASILEMKNSLPAFTKDIVDLKKENDALKKDVAYLKNEVSKINCLDLNAIEIHGLQKLPHVNEDNKFGITERILKEVLNIHIEERDLDECLIIKKKNSADKTGLNSTKKLNSASKTGCDFLVVHFISRRLRETVLECWRGVWKSGKTTFDVLGHTGLPIRMNERLSKSTRDLLFQAKAVARDVGWSFVWVKKGRILLRKKENDKVLNINSLDDIEKYKNT